MIKSLVYSTDLTDLCNLADRADSCTRARVRNLDLDSENSKILRKFKIGFKPTTMYLLTRTKNSPSYTSYQVTNAKTKARGLQTLPCTLKSSTFSD
jgi:hypothetical protein